MLNSIIFSASTSVSHVYDNATQAVEMYLQSMLPKDYLKDSSVSTKSSFRYFKKFINTRKEFEKKQRPFMIIRPTFEDFNFIDGSDFLSGTHIVWYGAANGGSGHSIQTFIKDPKNYINMGFKINRCKMSFDVAIQTNTFMQAVDISSYLSNTIPWGRTIYLPTSLESMIPNPMIDNLCEMVGIDIGDPENIPVLTKYIRKHSSYPISYKMMNSTGNNQYFLFYPQNILATFTDIRTEERSMKNMVEDFANVTFRIDIEFNAISSYVLCSKKGIEKKLQLDIHRDDGTFTPIYTYERIFDDRDYIDKGYKLYSSNIIKTSPELDGKSESMDIRQCMPMDLQKVINQMLAVGDDVDLLLKTRVIFNNRDASRDIDYAINWSNYNLTINKTDKTLTYRFIIYMNLSYYTSYTIEEKVKVTDQQNMNIKSRLGLY